MEDQTPTTLTPNDHGFKIKFANGFSLSVQYGYGTYSDNKVADMPADTNTVEIAILHPNGEFAILNGDVAGYVPVRDLPEIMDMVSIKEWEGLKTLVGDYAKMGGESPDFTWRRVSDSV